MRDDNGIMNVRNLIRFNIGICIFIPDAHIYPLKTPPDSKITFYQVIFFENQKSFIYNDRLLLEPFEGWAVPHTVTLVFAPESEKKLSCQNSIQIHQSVHGSFIRLKDPGRFLNSWQKCSFTLKSKNTPVSQHCLYLNRTFADWCYLFPATPKPITRTIEALLSRSQTKTCNSSAIGSLHQTNMLSLSNLNIEDLSPLSSLINLKSLWLDYNKIINIEPLITLQKLEVLGAKYNSISVIKPLAHIKSLRWIFLDSNIIQNIEDLSYLPKLSVLSLQKNQIKSYQSILKFNPNTLKILKLHKNPIKEEECLTLLKNSSFKSSCHTLSTSSLKKGSF
jgi:hypothetical protein